MESTNIRIYADIQPIEALKCAVGAEILIKLVINLTQSGIMAAVVGRFGAAAHAATHRGLFATSFDNKGNTKGQLSNNGPKVYVWTTAHRLYPLRRCTELVLLHYRN